MSTPPGVGAVALVRLSGGRALDVLHRLAPRLADEPLVARRATLVRLVAPDGGRQIDRGLATWFPGPGSYTGEDVVELSVHGGWLTPELVLDACRAAGARVAEPGEFTRRAYLNGKLDLVQVEAVADLIEARSVALHGAALHQLDRGLSRRLSELRQGIVHLEALLVHHLDFPDEDEPPVPVPEIVREAEEFAAALDRLLETAPEGELLREGAVAVLAGRPNTGKSTLFNALIGSERAIVTDVPGTTRDAIEATVSLGSFPFRLVDTAGLREADEVVETMGIEVAHRYLDAADVVLYCSEAGYVLGESERAFVAGLGAPVVLVETMADRRAAQDLVAQDRAAAVPGDGLAGAVRVSAISGQGLGELRDLLAHLVYRGLVEGGVDVPVVTRARQAEGVRRAKEHVGRFVEALASGVPVEFASTHLRPAETALEEVLGVVTDDDVLDHLFETFCIGK